MRETSTPMSVSAGGGGGPDEDAGSEGCAQPVRHSATQPEDQSCLEESALEPSRTMAGNAWSHPQQLASHRQWSLADSTREMVVGHCPRRVVRSSEGLSAYRRMGVSAYLRPAMASQRPIYVCYIVRCAGGTLYTGVTTDIGRRVEEHNAGDGARYTASRRPVRLVWTEAHHDRAAAQRREAQIKRWSRESQEIGIVRRRPEVDVIGHNRAGGHLLDAMNRWKERTDGSEQARTHLDGRGGRPGAWDWQWPGRAGDA